MDVLPSIDLHSGKVVRLLRGDYAKQIVYSDDPAAVAKDFAAAGAAWVHVVDLEAALTGSTANIEALRSIRKATQAKIEYGGGARSDERIAALLDEGVDRVVVGSAAMGDWAWFERLCGRKELAGKIALGLDAKGGKVAVHGWTRQTQATPLEIAARVSGWPLGAIVYTDISRDGMLEGVNIAGTAELIQVTDVPVVASGGVCSLEDVVLCRSIGCRGVIIGRAYYEGRVDVGQACELAGEAKDATEKTPD